MAGTKQNFEFATSGGAQSFTPNTDIVLIYPDTTLLTGNVSISTASPPQIGDTVKCVLTLTGLSLNGFTLTIFGLSFTQEMIDASNGDLFILTGTDVPITSYSATYCPNFAQSDFLSGDSLVDGSVSLSKLESVTDGSIVAGGAGNVPTILSVAGVLTAVRSLSTLVFSFAAGSIVNAAISASAAIARSKLANGTASQVVINDAGGVMTSEAQLATSRGGTGQDTSASTGFAKVSAGTWSVSALTDVALLKVSWETGYVGDFKILMPFAGTVTGIYGFLDKAVGASDALVTPKNNAGTTMTSGVLTFTASDPKGTAETSTPSANNTFIAGDVLTFTTSGGSAAGVAQLSITYTRTS